MLLIAFLNLSGGFLKAQSVVFSEDLFTKYLLYKERFSGHFLIPGTSPGCSIPFSTRRIEGKEHLLRSGESTLKLGNYIALLGTEYRMFKEKGFPPEQTLEELYYALFAINRLDLASEPNDPSGDFVPQLNGLFIREDFPIGFFKEHQDQLNRDALPWEGPRPRYVRGSGRLLQVTGNREEKINDHRGLPHRYMSHDHAIRVLWGLRMAYTMLDDNLNYQRLPFQDGVVDFKKEISAIYNRILGYFEQNNWRIRRPNGDKVDRGALVYIFKRELRRSLEVLEASEEKSDRHKRFTLFYGLFHRPFHGLSNANAWMNGRMQIETQNLSGNSYRAWERCLPFGYEPYFIPYGLLVHDWQLPPVKREILKENMLFYLEMAPDEGNFYHSGIDFSTYGWATPDRTERPLEDVWLGIFERGNFSGLDFMLMHNFFYLVFDSFGQEVFLYEKDKVYRREWQRIMTRLSPAEIKAAETMLEDLLSQSKFD